MDDSKLLTNKKNINLEYSYKWLHRAQDDLKIFKKLVPCDRDTRKIVYSKDSALAVYLLQQSVEKATKAVAAATGKFPYRKLKGHGHNSLAVLLDFYKQTIFSIGSNPIATVFSQGLGLDIDMASTKMRAILAESQKTYQHKKLGGKIYREQFAAASVREIDSILDFLLNIRKEGFIGSLRSLFGVHGKVLINGKQMNTSTPEDLFISFLAQANKQMNIPQLSSNQQEAMLEMIKALPINEISHENKNEKYIIKRQDFEEQNLGQWSLIVLLFLAAFTFPHESTSRYPRPLKKAIEPGGCEDYTEQLGIVNRIGRLGYIATLAINELRPELETISSFFPVVESELI